MRFGHRLDKLLKSLLALFLMIFQVGVQDSKENKGTLKCKKIRPMEEDRLLWWSQWCYWVWQKIWVISF